MTASDCRLLAIHTITRRPIDLPGAAFAVRTSYIEPGVVRPGPLLGTADTLPAARALVPPEADCRLPPGPQDDPVIVESWV